MNNENEKFIQNFFYKNNPEVPDDYFSGRVMQK